MMVGEPDARLPVPIPGSYWVIRGLLLAGEYPGALDPEEASSKVKRLVDSGIELFIDLTYGEGEGLRPYAEHLYIATNETGREVKRVNVPIRDTDVPTHEQMVHILDLIDDAVESKKPVYVHCWGGIGRTGTVVGCYLVRHGLVGEDGALARIADLRQDTPDGARPSPENALQSGFVYAWQVGE